jgi:hypothetical protein
VATLPPNKQAGVLGAGGAKGEVLVGWAGRPGGSSSGLVSGRAPRVNIGLDEGLLARIDDVSKRSGLSRSALMARGGGDRG